MRFRLSLSISFLLFGPPTAAAAQDWINQVKSAPQDFRGRLIRLKGEAVEIRSATPLATQGIYRLMDASDPTGVLIRSTDLPRTGGPFEVQARLSPQLLSQGSLLLDEIRRSEPFRIAGLIPGAIGILGLVACVVALVLLVRARRAVRHHRLGPPLWLIPTREGENGESEDAILGAGVDPQRTEHRFDYHLTEIDDERAHGLVLQARQLGHVFLASAVVAAAGGTWWIVAGSKTAAEPIYITQMTESMPAPGVTDTGGGRDSAQTLAQDEPGQTESTPFRVVPPPPPAAASRPAETEARRPGTPVTPAQQPRDSLRGTPPRRDTVVTDFLPPPTPPPAPQPAPAPPPPPPPPPPRRDPRVEREAATGVLRQGLARVGAALEAKDLGALEGMYPPDDHPDWRRRFLQHLRQNSPAAAMGRTGDVLLLEGGAEAAVTISFSWRANFGVERKQDARFAAMLQRTSQGYEFIGIRLLEPFP